MKITIGKSKVGKLLLRVLVGFLSLFLLAMGVVVAVYESRTVPVPASTSTEPGINTYRIVGTGQETFWDAQGNEISQPADGSLLFGQNAQNPGNTPSYKDNGDGTITDLVSGLQWTKTLDLNGDGKINFSDQMSVGKALESAANVTVGGYSDWRIPTLKEAYSLINFNGVDIGLASELPASPKPYIDTNY
jgi:hypothetical protein